MAKTLLNGVTLAAGSERDPGSRRCDRQHLQRSEHRAVHLEATDSASRHQQSDARLCCPRRGGVQWPKRRRAGRSQSGGARHPARSRGARRRQDRIQPTVGCDTRRNSSPTSCVRSARAPRMAADRATGISIRRASAMGMDVFRPPSVFSYFAPATVVAGTAGVRGPEFGILSTSTALRRHQLRQHHRVLANCGERQCPRRHLDRSHAASAVWQRIPASLVDVLDALLLHGTMSDEMKSSIAAAVAAVAPHQPAQARPHGRVSGPHVIAVSGGEIAMKVTRREFLLQTGSCVGYALGAAAFVAGVQRFSLINAFAQGSDYRALVCVFLAGGNDGNNMIVPTSTTGYNAYANGARRIRARPSRATRSCRSRLSGAASPFGLHPNLVELHTLWNEQKLATVCNVGPLVQPITRRALSRWRSTPVSAVLALRSDRAVADGHCRTHLADGMGGPHGRSLCRAPIRFSGHHRALGRYLHARANQLTACLSRTRRRLSTRCWC